MTSKTFFSADLHLNHGGVIGMCQRPFADIEVMNEALIANWNERVGPRDTVWFLGDFAMGASPAECQAFFSKLRGRKHLVRGNHDRKRVLDLPWESQHDIAQISVDGQRLFLSHYAARAWPGVWRGAIHLFGHTHATLPPTRQSCDVGVDAWGFRPVTLGEIREMLAGVSEPPEEIRLARAREGGE